MSNKDYYDRWLKVKEQIKSLLKEDEHLQNLAAAPVGIKPQGAAVEIVARVYCTYCELYNKLCDFYDQMEQVQRRPYIKSIIDAVTCRLIELKSTLEEVEVFEFTYPENALQQLLMVPQEIQILCPFHYPFEIRQKEQQTIIDNILSGNRLGDAFLNRSQKMDEDNQIEEKEIESKSEVSSTKIESNSLESDEFTPEKLYNSHLLNIQRMERSRHTVRQNTKKFNKDNDLYLELAGLKVPQAKESLRIKAATYIQKLCRRFMQLKREHFKENALKFKLGMIIPSWSPPSAKIQLEKVKEERRNFRQKYYEEWLYKNIKENSRVLRLREGEAMEDISSEIRQWFREWYDAVRQFDEFPWPQEGGSILIVKGETFTIPEYIEWRGIEEKRLEQEAGNPKTKQQIKDEKKAAAAEKKKMELEIKIKEQKRLADYKKKRLNPANDPGIYFKVGKHLEPVEKAWEIYENQWKDLETPNNVANILKGYILELVTESAYQELQFKVRPVVDEMMKLELKLLRKSLKEDYRRAGVEKLPITMRRKKPKGAKQPKPDKVPPVAMFQSLVDEGIIRKYPHITLDDYWGDKNYAAADTRAILWTPIFSPPCLGDVKEQVQIRCLLTLGSECPEAWRTQLLVGSKDSGKKTLAYAIATETNSILIDLSPFNVYNKYPGPKNWKTMFNYINRISKLMEPTVIFIDNADKIFCKKVPPAERALNPQRLAKNLYKDIVKPLQGTTKKILVIGTASEPWLAKKPQLYKVFPSVIMIPRSDYGSISYILTKILMKYHALDREFNVHSIAQVLRGYDINSIRQGIESLLSPERVAQLYHKPLKPMEVINALLNFKGGVVTEVEDYEIFTQWYLSYTPWGEKYLDYMRMLELQLQFKLKAEKKK